MLFKDRQHAGDLLAEALSAYRATPVVILGLARGGVVVAARVASSLGIPVDVLVVKKLASPMHSEYAIGAIAPDNVFVVRWKEAQRVGADEVYMRQERLRVTKLIDRQQRQYRKGKKPIMLDGKTVVLIDDGAATGATMEVAVLWARKRRAKKIIIVLPVASFEAGTLLRPEADAYVVYREDKALISVGAYYESFPPVTDDEVVELLRYKPM